MCIIIDKDTAHKVFGDPVHSDFIPVWEWLRNNGGRLVYGGKNGRQLFDMARARDVILEWNKAGIALEVSGVEQEQEYVEREMTLKSNDPHIIALARRSGARILSSMDRALEEDFKDISLVPRPQGKIYKYAEHRHLLKHGRACKSNCQDS